MTGGGATLGTEELLEEIESLLDEEGILDKFEYWDTGGDCFLSGVSIGGLGASLGLSNGAKSFFLLCGKTGDLGALGNSLEFSLGRESTLSVVDFFDTLCDTWVDTLEEETERLSHVSSEGVSSLFGSLTSIDFNLLGVNDTLTVPPERTKSSKFMVGTLSGSYIEEGEETYSVPSKLLKEFLLFLRT